MSDRPSKKAKFFVAGVIVVASADTRPLEWFDELFAGKSEGESLGLLPPSHEFFGNHDAWLRVIGAEAPEFSARVECVSWDLLRYYIRRVPWKQPAGERISHETNERLSTLRWLRRMLPDPESEPDDMVDLAMDVDAAIASGKLIKPSIPSQLTLTGTLEEVRDFVAEISASINPLVKSVTIKGPFPANLPDDKALVFVPERTHGKCLPWLLQEVVSTPFFAGLLIFSSFDLSVSPYQRVVLETLLPLLVDFTVSPPIKRHELFFVWSTMTDDATGRHRQNVNDLMDMFPAHFDGPNKVKREVARQFLPNHFEEQRMRSSLLEFLSRDLASSPLELVTLLDANVSFSDSGAIFKVPELRCRIDWSNHDMVIELSRRLGRELVDPTKHELVRGPERESLHLRWSTEYARRALGVLRSNFSLEAAAEVEQRSLFNLVDFYQGAVAKLSVALAKLEGSTEEKEACLGAFHAACVHLCDPFEKGAVPESTMASKLRGALGAKVEGILERAVELLCRELRLPFAGEEIVLARILQSAMSPGRQTRT